MDIGGTILSRIRYFIISLLNIWSIVAISNVFNNCQNRIVFPVLFNPLATDY